MKVLSVIKYLIALAAAVLLMYFSFKKVDWDAFVIGFQECRWRFVLLAMAASVAAFFFRSQRWRDLMKPFDPKMDSLTAFDGVNIGYLANFVFPRIGEVVRCGFVADRSRRRHKEDPENMITFDKAIGTVLLSRTCDVLVVFILIGVLLAGMWQEFGSFFVDKIWHPFRARFDISLWWVALIALILMALFFLVLHFFKGKNPVAAKIASFIHGIIDGFESFVKMKDKGWFVLYTILLWAMYWLMSISTIWAMPQLDGLCWTDAWFVCLVGSVAWMVPVPGGFGAYHALVALALTSIYGLCWDDGMLFATLNHEAQAITMFVCGGISYLVELTRK